MRLACIIVGALLLSGCESPGLYSWGGYQDELYRYYDKPEKRLRVIEHLETHISNLEARQQIVPPGLYAEVGTFYLELGDELKAVEFYKKETEVWPESQALMQVMIQNLEARTVRKEANDAT